MVHRHEFERKIGPNEVHVGQVIRFERKDNILDFTGFVVSLEGNVVQLIKTTGLHQDKSFSFCLSEIVSITEILFCPLFNRIREKVSGEKASGGKKENVDWTMVNPNGDAKQFHFQRAPRLI